MEGWSRRTHRTLATMHSLLYTRPITGVGIRGSTYALLLLIHQINEHRQRRRRCNDCRIQITIGKICPTSTGVRDNVVIVPLANSRKRKTRCGFSSLFRSCKLAPISFNLLSAAFFSFFFYVLYFICFEAGKQRLLFHQYRFICPPVVPQNIYDLSLPRKYNFYEFRWAVQCFNSFCSDMHIQ